MTGPVGEPTLAAVLSCTARRLTDTHLALLSAIGILGAVLMFAILASAWALGLLFLAVGSFAGWAMASRQPASSPAGSIASAVFRRLFAAMGVSCVFAFALAMLATALGTWIS